MRDFRNAKAMAQSLRANLADKGIEISISQSLELISKAFGAADWNTLAAAINAAMERNPPRPVERHESSPSRTLFSAELEVTLLRASEYAKACRHPDLTIEHLLIALIDDADASSVMKACEVDLAVLKRGLDDQLDLDFDSAETPSGSPKPSAGFQRAIQRAIVYAGSTRETVTGSLVLFTLYSEQDGVAAKLLKDQAMTRKDVAGFIQHYLVS